MDGLYANAADERSLEDWGRICGASARSLGDVAWSVFSKPLEDSNLLD